MKFKIFILFIFITMVAFKSDKPAYKIYTKSGKEVKYSKMLKKLENADVVFFGELHNNPIAHWLQIELTQDLFEIKKENLILAAEMFESDNQIIMDEYLSGLIKQSKFEDEMRLWSNYKTDYKPLVQFAKENNLKFIASNIPRRYASVVFSKGFEGIDELSNEAKTYIAPLPIDYDPNVECYKKMLSMGTGGMHSNDNLPKAQAIKDATMAHFIYKNLSPDRMLLHYNGTYHSDNYEGIVWYLKQKSENLSIVTIATVQQSDIDSLSEDFKDLADFILCIPENMTTTY
ncbi:MAG: ChaN family lipoprotein [Bacteroidetes bacterium]|jgi:uncharacterized iron-regulated protein|nr:ChaN family lipoprotein [Bacteroidota bacterium]MBT6685789.1 ChaN family lipoprotein [Bacteroidota bacterium]MBT7142359.1 ChaN family lipoprotein [Bacteroidota bacterium]MBT7490173.1 ChaN family lipoprotein [Bacteroidota bacterium]